MSIVPRVRPGVSVLAFVVLGMKFISLNRRNAERESDGAVQCGSEVKSGAREKTRSSARRGSATPPPDHPEKLSSHHARKHTFGVHAFLPSRLFPASK
jgi:hypothetical protein